MDERIKLKINKRLESNIKILDIVRKYCETYPDMRFGQVLANLHIIEYDDTQLHNVIDPFFDESVDIINRIPKKYRK